MIRFKFIAKNNVSKLPKSPGIYAFKKAGEVLYIGKAANLKDRVKNHFQQPAFRSNLFINQADKIGYIKTDSEIEALLLEAKLIKKYQPKYNIMWRDDKNYFFIGITKEDFPTIFITHQPLRQAQGKQKLKADYVGPFVEGRALKQTLNTLRRVFPYRTCKPYSGKPCMWYQLGRCPGPCLLGSELVKEMPKLEESIKKESQRNAKNLKKILEVGKGQVLKDLKKEMEMASKIRDFEMAAKVRDQIRALERVLSHARLLEIIEPEKENWEKTEKEIKKILNMKTKISRIEAYDVSNIQGQNATGSMITFIKGKPNKNFYRKFKVRIEGKPDDVAMIKEILGRRFSHPEWGWPDLILIDGGITQFNAALQIKNKRRIRKSIKVLSLAKKENRLFIEGRKQTVFLKSLPRDISNLILQLRDEAHRFAVAYHRRLREKF